MAGSQAHLLTQVRALESHDELREAVRLQREIWGFDDMELLPLRLFIVASSIGGQVFGAFHESRMVGFCLAVPALKPGGELYLHSQMAGVVEEYRNLGVARQLKLAQRADALSRGIRLIEWTFDPLSIKNAHFNVERLGAVVRRYLLNQYGQTTSPLHGALPTDRCVAEWHLSSPRVEALLSGEPLPRLRVIERIGVPVAIEQLRRDEPAKARQIQAEVSDQFLRCLRDNLYVAGFARSAESGTYLLSQWDSN